MTLEDLKKQYSSLKSADEKAFIKNLHSAYSSGIISKSLLLAFLEQTLLDFKPEGKRICSSCGNANEDDRRMLLLHTKIAGVIMKIKKANRSFASLRETALLFLAYSSTSPNSNGTALSLFIDTLSYKVVDVDLDWRLLQEAMSMDILCYELDKKFRFDKSSPASFRIDGKGLFICDDGRMRIASSDVGRDGDVAFSLFDNRLEIVTRNVRDERLKYSDRDSACELAHFADVFIKAQNEYHTPTVKKTILNSGDRVDIMITGFSEDNNTIFCRTVGTGQIYSGSIANQELVKGSYTSDLIPYLLQDDYIPNAIIEKANGDDSIFSIRDSYLDYAIERAKDDSRNNRIIEATVCRVSDSLFNGRIIWLTTYGYFGLSIPDPKESYKVGDKKFLSVLNYQPKGQDVFINLIAPKPYGKMDNTRFDSDYVLSDYVLTKEDYEKSAKQEEDIDENLVHNKEALALFATMIANSSTIRTSFESYRRGLAAMFLFTLLGDSEAFDALASEMYYLCCCISFAQGSRIRVSNKYDFPEDRTAVLGLLSMWENKEDELIKFVSGLPLFSLSEQIGSLMLGIKLSSRFSDDIKVDTSSVRKKICSLLGVESMFVQESSFRFGKYGKAEGQAAEFKSSYVFRNDAKGADIDYQGRGQVFEAVCGFLNSEGGVLYLGVKDNGDPITEENYGLNADIKWLRANYQTINAKRARQLGHPVNEVRDYDSFVQFLNSEKELYFKESLLENIRIEVTDDVDAIRISVEPALYEIAYLYTDKERSGGQAFVRDGGRTIVMTTFMKERRMANLKRIGKEMAFIVTIKEAIDNGRKLVFKGYSSGNSGKVEDRRVVPVNLFYNDENVYCYDLDSREYKQFRLRRIASIEILPGTYPLPKSAQKEADVFRWLNEGKKQYHIKLRMDVGAKNYLLEEYSCAELLPETELYEEKKDKWILDTKVNGLEAVRRFYIGLADKIEILETEDSSELISRIAEFVKMNIRLVY